jgi:hypothetical protein
MSKKHNICIQLLGSVSLKALHSARRGKHCIVKQFVLRQRQLEHLVAKLIGWHCWWESWWAWELTVAPFASNDTGSLAYLTADVLNLGCRVVLRCAAYWVVNSAACSVECRLIWSTVTWENKRPIYQVVVLKLQSIEIETRYPVTTFYIQHALVFIRHGNPNVSWLHIFLTRWQWVFWRLI